MFFQTYYRIGPYNFEPFLDLFAPGQFDCSREEFSLFLRNDRSSHDDGGREILVQTLHRERGIPADVVAVFSEADEPDFNSPERDYDGFHPYPLCYREFVTRLHSFMDRKATELFNVVRWRLGIVGGPLALTSDWPFMRWHDPKLGERVMDKYGFLNRQILAGCLTLDMPAPQEVRFDVSSRHAIETLLDAGSHQPIYHDIFREAWQRKASNGRSALVMAIAAAETAFKTTVIDLSPDTAWILDNLPSPPLDKMVREYLQLLPARNNFGGVVRRPPKSVITKLKNGIELRNKVVHRGAEELDPTLLEGILIAIRDLLYLLDFYRGHEWALGRISADVTSELRATPS